MIELHPSKLRNRHTAANDIKTALIKRINRAMQKYGIGWKVQVNRDSRSYIYDTVSQRFVTYYDNLYDLAAIWKVTNATAGCDITLTQGATPRVAPSYSSHY
jgi:hypothetical protein